MATRTERNDGPINEPDYLSLHKGKPLGTRIKGWLVTLDHKRIGVMYLTGILISLLVGGAFALLVRTELWSAGKTIVDPDTYNKFFTLHGAVMVFLVIIPGIPAALGNIIMPIQLGAPDVAFPKLNLASFYLWISGALFLVIAIPFGGLDTGWTLYTPYSLQSPTPVLLSVIGVFLLGFSSIFTGLNFLVTIHKFRPQGMTWFQMPLNIWAIYATAIMQVLATPVLGITVGLLAVERFAHIGIFDPNMGGDPVLFQHFFWFYSHPAVYIMIIPAMGVISEMLSTFSRKPIFGYRFIAYSSVSLALLSFLVWGHHMFVSGQSRLANMVFSALTFTVGIPAAIKVFNWVSTLYKGDIRLKTPMIYTLSFLLLFTIGGLTGLFLGVLAIDVHLHDTYFVVAHFHYVMMGSTLVAFLGALHHWWPKFTGRMYNEAVGRMCGIGVFIGFNMTFLPQFVMGSQGMPRRYWDYDVRYQTYHQVSTIGAFILGISMFITIVSLVSSLKNGRRAARNPWGATSLEWQCPTPPPLYNFEKPPVVHEIYNYDDLVEVEEDVWERRAPEHVEPHEAPGNAHDLKSQPVTPVIEGRKADEVLSSEGGFVGAVEPPSERKRKPTEPPPIPERAKRPSEIKTVESKPEAKAEEPKAEVKEEAKPGLTAGWDVPEVPAELKDEAKAISEEKKADEAKAEPAKADDKKEGDK